MNNQILAWLSFFFSRLWPRTLHYGNFPLEPNKKHLQRLRALYIFSHAGWHWKNWNFCLSWNSCWAVERWAFFLQSLLSYATVLPVVLYLFRRNRTSKWLMPSETVYLKIAWTCRSILLCTMFHISFRSMAEECYLECNHSDKRFWK